MRQLQTYKVMLMQQSCGHTVRFLPAFVQAWSTQKSLVKTLRYTPTISQFYGVDPLAEKYPAFNPYNYTLNNPVMLVDPDGTYATKLGAIWGWIKSGFKGKIFKSDNPATPYHKFGIINTTYGKDGSVIFNVKFGYSKSKMKSGGAIETNDGRLEWHGTIKKTNLIQTLSLIRSAPAKTTSDKFLKIGVELTYGTIDDAQGLFTGRSISGEDLRTNEGVEKRIMGMVTIATLGAGRWLKGLKVSGSALESTPELYRDFSKSTKGLFKGVNHNLLRSKAYHKMIFNNNLGHDLQHALDLSNDLIRAGTIMDINNN